MNALLDLIVKDQLFFSLNYYKIYLFTYFETWTIENLNLFSRQ